MFCMTCKILNLHTLSSLPFSAPICTLISLFVLISQNIMQLLVKTEMSKETMERSLIQIKNKWSPRMDPSGTPGCMLVNDSVSISTSKL